ncbi:zinc finger protein-like 1 homolog [Procambarus clarkii]|uniref:zinc finger protein-like 1 homolog n=1 Tax=Procambarus clarkii TaxID=6728 RepID=UPI001E671D00|nr:zinc finger protein-like 1 [Procambarus clarkii]
MGLCKCSKKKVTNQFCFEHRVNVCEQCIVEEHTTCVVQSYLHWLDGSDYNPVCRICDDQLAAGECIRLVCYDLFHKECLNDWASRLPPHTAPAGYKCPVCSEAIFPPANYVSPVAERLRETLAIFPWARTGLGLPLIANAGNSDEPDWSAANGTTVAEMDSSDHLSSIHSRPAVTQAKPMGETKTRNIDTTTRVHDHGSSKSCGGTVSDSGSTNVRVTAIEDPPITPSQFRETHHPTGSGVTRKGSSSETRLTVNDKADVDDDENKYKRRSAIEWFGRWWRTMSRPPSRHHQSLIGGRRRMIIVLVLLACATLLVVLSYLGHGASDNDPLLDPHHNPNIHVEGE